MNFGRAERQLASCPLADTNTERVEVVGDGRYDLELFRVRSVNGRHTPASCRRPMVGSPEAVHRNETKRSGLDGDELGEGVDASVRSP